jgi:hypothetical protein
MLLRGARFEQWGSLALAALVAACTQSPGETTAAATGNHAPVISGTPPTAVVQGVAYSFTPTASDPDGDALTFGIDAKPSWGVFDTSTGRLSGAPGATDVGVARGIVIWVSDGHGQTALPAFDVTVSAQPVTNHAPTISGTPPTAVVAGATYSFTPSASDPTATRSPSRSATSRRGRRSPRRRASSRACRSSATSARSPTSASR